MEHVRDWNVLRAVETEQMLASVCVCCFMLVLRLPEFPAAPGLPRDTQAAVLHPGKGDLPLLLPTGSV